MSTTIIISLCILLLFAYVFDITSSRTKIPSVILLILSGWGVKQATLFFEIPVPNLGPALPVLGTVALILIVLEGSLELKLDKSKVTLIRKSSLMAIFQMFVISFGLGYAFYYFGGTSFRNGLINAIPLAITSSAVAIPSVRNLLVYDKEFITYESSLSDIFGVIFFNYIALNDTLNTRTFAVFLLQMLVMSIVTFVSTLGLAFLLSKIRHHVKFIPIILLVILIYTISKEYHLPSLILILIFGLFIGNLDELKQFRIIEKLKPEVLELEVRKFKEITIEITFTIRALLFLVFGFMIENTELQNAGYTMWAVGITAGIFIIRFFLLKFLRLQTTPLLYIAPRGLITILLLISIPESHQTGAANISLFIQIILLSAFVMMLGLLRHKNKEKVESR